jgi:hypothetical protein
MLLNIKRMATKKVAEKSQVLYCSKCDYSTSRLNDYNKHLLTRKHNYGKEATSEATASNINLAEKKILYCNCGKTYLDRTGLWRHKKKCNINDGVIYKNNLDEHISIAVNDVIKEYINDTDNKQHELMMQLIKNQTDLQSVMKDIIKSGITNTNTNNINNTNTINSHNKTFNLHMYLNETCKNAMNLSDFVETIKPTLEELELTGRVGYAKGISHIFTSRLDVVNKEENPIQCTDGKREILYIKENNIWNKEDEGKPLLTKAIKMITHKNLCNISEWQKMYPDCTNSESRKNDTYLKIVLNSMPGGTDEETTLNYEKIMSSVAKNTVIDK